jgi:hypothetical protein
MTKQALLFCEQKRRKKNFDLRGVLATALPHPIVSKGVLPQAGSLLFFKKEALTSFIL